MRKIRVLFPLAFLLLLWLAIWRCSGSALVPSPWSTMRLLGGLLCDGGTWMSIILTLWRGLLGLLFAAIAAYALGIPCGLRSNLMDMMSPLVAVAQGCPPIVWISLLMVWAGTGMAVPLVVVFASTFPVLFINIAQGTRGLDKGLLEMAKLYCVPRRRILRSLILPGISGASKSGFSFALGITWKVAATAEFFGAEDGIGARIQLSFQRLDMQGLFAWTAIIACIGIVLDAVQKRFRKKS